MKIVYLFVFLSCLLPYLWASVAKFTGPGFINDAPRDFLDSLKGLRKRAHWAQLNNFEALPLHIFSVFVAVQLSTLPTFHIIWATGAFLFFRILYGFCYIKNLPNWRSTVWFLALIANSYLILASIIGT